VAILGLCMGWVCVVSSLRYMIIWVDPNTTHLINQVNPVKKIKIKNQVNPINSNTTCLTKRVTHVIHQSKKLLDLNPRLYIDF
jgi:hypothetical protein